MQHSFTECQIWLLFEDRNVEPKTEWNETFRQEPGAVNAEHRTQTVSRGQKPAWEITRGFEAEQEVGT